MALFTYKARTPDGKKNRGQIEATTASEAAAKLKARSLLVLEVNPTHSHRAGKPRRVRLSLKDKVVLTEQLAVMIKAGLPVSGAFIAMLNQTFSAPIHAMLADISAQVEGGSSLAAALERYYETFGRVYIKMVAAGEKGGKLDDILDKLALQLQKDYDIRSRIRSALLYPLIIVILMIVVVIVIMVAVIPKLASVFTSANVALPLATRILIGTSNFIVAHGIVMAIVAVVAVFGIRLLLRQDGIHLIWDKIKVRIPVFGPFATRVYMARFSLTFASLLSSGLPILEIFDTSKEVIDNRAYQLELDEIAHQIENGSPIAKALESSHYFPNMMSQLVGVGEKSGSLEEIMWVIARFYEKEVETVSRNLSAALEPIIMVFLGVGIAFILISVLQPMYSLVSAI